MASFITGGNGFVGRFLLEYVSANQPNEPLYCLVRDLAASQWMEAYPNITRIKGDLLAPDSYRDIAQKADLIYHLAAKLGLRNGDEFYEQNTKATQCLVDVLKSNHSLSRLVFVSSIAAVDRDSEMPALGPLTIHSKPCPSSDYGKSKLLAEEAIQASGLPYTILRPAYIYGGRTRKGSSVDKFLQDILTGASYTRILFPGRASAIEVRDLAEVIYLVGQTDKTLNQVYFAADPKPLGVAEVMQQAAKAFQLSYSSRTIDSQTMTRLQAYCYAKAANPVIARILFEDAFYCDSAPLWQALEREPSILSEVGLSEALNAYYEMETAFSK